MKTLATLLAATLALPLAAQTVTTVVNNGPTSELYDMVILGDGYTAGQQAQFNADVQDVINYFRTNVSTYPYNAYFQCFNVHSVFRASVESGADQPPLNIFRNTVYDATYWAGGVERCLYIQNTAQAAADAALAPDSDGRVIVLVNDPKYGGCASAYSVSYNGTDMENVQAHEWGHSFGGLADEYDYGASGTYSGAEFAEPNVTNSSTGNKWAPWLGFAGPEGTVGAYLGARYHTTGVWRPEPECEMRSLYRNFCSICREALVLAYNRECDLITAESPSTLTSARQFTVKSFSFVNRLASRPHTIEWQVDSGPWVAGSTSFAWNVGAATTGLHGVRVRLRDTAPDVRSDPSDFRTHTHTWVVNVLAATDARITEVMPSDAATVEQNSTSSFPWGASGNRSMYAYGRSVLGHDHPVHIAGIAFRPNGGAANFGPTTYNLTVDVSTGSVAPSALSATFDSNHGADRTRAFDGPLTIDAAVLGGASPSAFVLQVPFKEPFAWNPRSGPLVLDLRNLGIVSGTGISADGALGTGGDFARALNGTNPDAATATTTGQNFGLAVQLILASDTVPNTLTFAEGNSSSAYPWGLTSPSRALYAYDGAVFGSGGRRQITRLAWRTENGAAFPGGTYDLRVDLSTGAQNLSSSLNATYDLNHGPDRTVVFDGVATLTSAPAAAAAPSGYNVQLELQRPFEFDPSAGSLVVDLVLRSGIGGGASCDGSNVAGSGHGRVFGAGTGPTGTVQFFALAMAVSGVPSPTLPQANDSAEASSTTSFPWGATAPNRAMNAYTPDMLGVANPVEITHLSWRPDGAVSTIGPVTFSAQIDLSTGGAVPLTNSFASNHGSNLTTVFNGQFSVPYYSGRAADPEDMVITVKLDRPFRWDPADGALIVDVRKFANVAGTLGGSLDIGSSSNQTRAVNTSDANGTTATLGPQNFITVLRLGGRGENGLAVTYGTGCGGALNGVPVNSTVGLPWTGNTDFRCALYRAAPGAGAFLTWGFAQAATPMVAFGAPSCTLLHDLALGSVFTVTNAAGSASWPMAVPNLPSLSGFAFRSQWLVLDASGLGSPGIAMTQGMQLTVK